MMAFSGAICMFTSLMLHLLFGLGAHLSVIDLNMTNIFMTEYVWYDLCSITGAIWLL